MALDQATSQFLQQLADNGAPAFHTLTPATAREFYSSLRKIIGDGPVLDCCQEFSVPVGDSHITLRALVPSQAPEGIIVYLHGGGWVLGDLDDYDTLGRFIATESNCVVVLVDYRLAPEHAFPTAINDAWAALQWVAVNQHRITNTGKTVPLIVAGDSAGANLAAVCARKARDSSTLEVAQQVLIYPVTQPNLDKPCYRDPSNQGLLSQADMAWFWDCYVPDLEQRNDPDVSPLLAEDLSRLPPAVVVTAEHDVLSEEGASYANRLEEAGVPVAFHKFKGQIHGFFTILNALPASEDARKYVIEHIRLVVAEHQTTPS